MARRQFHVQTELHKYRISVTYETFNDTDEANDNDVVFPESIQSVTDPSAMLVVNIGGPQRSCGTALVYIVDKKAVLQSILYDTVCSLDPKLEKRSGTQDLVRTLLSFVSNEYGISKFELTDNGYIECKGKPDISLSDILYIRDGRTWYEKHFDAKPENYKEVARLKAGIDKALNETMTFRSFIRKYDIKVDHRNVNIFPGQVCLQICMPQKSCLMN